MTSMERYQMAQFKLYYFYCIFVLLSFVWNNFKSTLGIRVNIYVFQNTNHFIPYLIF